MPQEHAVTIDELDWNALWRQARAKKTWRSKKAGDWDRKAASFARRTAASVYVDRFLALAAPDPDWTVLDMGCGPGTLALPLARMTRSVTAVDFSPVMLGILRDRAGEQGVDNIRTIQGSWNDDWAGLGIKTCDLALASRSLAVDDLRDALEKLQAHGRRKVVVTDRVGPGPLDPEAFDAVGRPLRTGPDYRYTFNLLCQMGQLPEVRYITLEQELRFPNHQEALDSYRWMFKDLDPDEEKRLARYVDAISTPGPDGSLILHRKQPPVWAFISWQPRPAAVRGRDAGNRRKESRCGS